MLLTRRAGPRRLTVDCHDCMGGRERRPCEWKPMEAVEPNFHTDQVGDRRALRAAYHTEKINMALGVVRAESAPPALLPEDDGAAAAAAVAPEEEEEDAPVVEEERRDPTWRPWDGELVLAEFRPKTPRTRFGKSLGPEIVRQGGTLQVRECVSGEREALAQGAHHRDSLTFVSQQMPSANCNPAIASNIPILIVQLLRHMEVAAFMKPGEHKERMWAFVGMDGCMFMRAWKLLKAYPELRANCALCSSLAHESWTYREMILKLLQPLLGEWLLHLHTAGRVTEKYKAMMKKGKCKHKSFKWLRVSPRPKP